MEMSLTAWEAKEQAGLLALETEEWRQRRLIAEDPNTTGDVLERFAGEALYIRKQNLRANQIGASTTTWKQSDLFLKSAAAHPNTPLPVLADLIGHLNFAISGFCRNPIASFLLLEQPSFLADLDKSCQQRLLWEANLLPLFVRLLATGGTAQDSAVQHEAQMHIAYAGEVANGEEGHDRLRDYWKALDTSPTAIIRIWDWKGKHVQDKGTSPNWLQRMTAISLTDTTNTPLIDDAYERTGLDLLNQLAHDGNRFVRWAAQTRLADPDFVFTWRDENWKV